MLDRWNRALDILCDTLSIPREKLADDLTVKVKEGLMVSDGELNIALTAVERGLNIDLPLNFKLTNDTTIADLKSHIENGAGRIA